MNKNIFKFRYIFIIFALGFLAFSLPIFMVWQHATTIKLAKQNIKDKNLLEKLRSKNALTTIYIEQFFTITNIEIIAKEKFGMRAPKTTEVVYIEKQVLLENKN